jgi:hypothetical protein
VSRQSEQTQQRADWVKAIEELIALTADEHAAAPRLGVHPEFVCQWRPRERLLPDGRTIIESGWEPSAGFVASALNIIRS